MGDLIEHGQLFIGGAPAEPAGTDTIEVVSQLRPRTSSSALGRSAGPLPFLPFGPGPLRIIHAHCTTSS